MSHVPEQRTITLVLFYFLSFDVSPFCSKLFVVIVIVAVADIINSCFAFGWEKIVLRLCILMRMFAKHYTKRIHFSSHLSLTVLTGQ